MARLMRCKYCGTLQDEPRGSKICAQCGGDLAFVEPGPPKSGAYVRAWLELDQIAAPAGQIVQRHLVLNVVTPDEVPREQRVHAAAGRDPLHFVAVLDVSGSMSGSKIVAAVEAVRQAVSRLQEGDVFSLVTFSTSVMCTLGARRVDAGLRRIVESALREVQAGGQTALCGGLEMGIAQAVDAPQGTNLVLLLSDGQANVGETDVEAVGRRALDARSRGVTVSTLGVGNDYNEALMAEIAIDGGGRFYHIADASQTAAYLTGELGEMTSLAARQAEVTLNLPPGAGIQPLSAAYPVRGNVLSLGDIPVDTTLEVVVRALLPPQPAGSRLVIDGALRYRSPAGNAFTVPLNGVTVRYSAERLFAPVEGAVRPIVRRVLGHMQAAGVLATSKAATRSAGEARHQGEVELATMRDYAALLGEQEEIDDVLSEGEEVLNFMAAPPGTTSPKAKMQTAEAMRRQRGSKKFSS